MTRKIIHDTKAIDGAVPTSFIIGTFSEYRYKTGKQECPCRRRGCLPPSPGCAFCKPDIIASQVEAAMKDERVARVMAHAAHESVRASLGLGTSSPRDASTAVWSAGLQGVESSVLASLKAVSHV